MRDQSGAAGRWSQRRKRGTTLIEMVLYLAIVATVVTFSIGLGREEQVRRERIALAAELQQVTTAAQTYVSADYENIRNQLLNDTAVGADMIRVYNLSQPVVQGFLPAIFVQDGSAPKSFVGSLKYGLAVRAVLRSNAALPPPTLKRTAALTVQDPGSNQFEFIPILRNNVFRDDPATPQFDDDEIDLEALLITVSSDPCVIVPAAQGPRIASQSESTAVGYVTGLGNGQTIPQGCSADVQNNLAWTGIEPGATALTATGPYGGWRLLLAPYSGLTLTAAQFPNSGGQVFDGRTAVQAGRFASLLALQDRPPLSESAKIARDGDSAQRCRDTLPNSAQELECRQSNQIYSNMSFTAWDSDNVGGNDQFPGLLNVNTLDMAPPLASGAAQITDLLSLSCTTDNTVTTAPGSLTVDCPQTQMQGLVVSGTADFIQTTTFRAGVEVDGAVTAGSAAVAGAVTAGSAAVDGDLTLNGTNIKANFDRNTVYTFNNTDALDVPKPECFGAAPKISASLVSYEAKDLRKQEITDQEFNTSWKVNLRLTVGSPAFSANTQVIVNPIGAKLLVQTWCSV
jgi:hypothetical protein